MSTVLSAAADLQIKGQRSNVQPLASSAFQGDPVIYIILGMHKSGTTLVSQILHHSGIDMGEFDEDVSYDRGNKYERQECLRLNMDILGAADFQVLHLDGGGQGQLTGDQRQAMQNIVRACSGSGRDWGFKDPRTCLTYRFWREELPEHRIIGVYRDPRRIWPRFKWMGMRRKHENFHRAYAFLARWQEHNLNVLRIFESTDQDGILLNYHDFMTGNESFARLQKFVERPLEDKRRAELYRSQTEGDLFLTVADRIMTVRSRVSVAGTLSRLDAVAAGARRPVQ